MPDQPLVSTPDAARALGMSARTLRRYVVAGWITPDLTLASGQYRWDVEKLREQINNMRKPDA
ncbi:MerR family transcriptional regulator [Pseudonocardia humida]|uniref:MerR family transcriptional regulator n=1 Tax=Pseudonocardia humida TaxID=2800819 RepID=A0ABT0ZTV9_9PSEU|nr:MerR family transcriptional regulator [Pseudonocardia humida]MCO1654158.1 MerR family transcriptional regulator [Pseudonocardia humida]